MDALALVTPGVQSLVGTILADGWTHARGTLAHLWSKKGNTSRETAEAELEKGYELSRHLQTEQRERDESRILLETHWTAYLGALAAVYGDLLQAIGELAAAQSSAARGTVVHNSNTGAVTTLTQLGDVNGNLSIGGR